LPISFVLTKSFKKN